MKILQIENLCKTYPGFKLDNVSFSLESGRIVGFIGRNGAGKTTTLKAMLNLVHPDSGSVSFFGTDFYENELEIKKRIGFVTGGTDFYPLKKLSVITAVTKRFYEKWDDAAYKRYIEMFSLDEKKTPSQLSAGMKVKYSLTLALSHGAELLILDEPTSGLDPVSRDDLLDVFLNLSREGKTILFSTHITSDLDKCADDIVYIKNGKIIARDEIGAFVGEYKKVELTEEQRTAIPAEKLIGCKIAKHGYTALVKTADADSVGVEYAQADLEDIMVHLDKEDI